MVEIVLKIKANEFRDIYNKTKDYDLVRIVAEDDCVSLFFVSNVPVEIMYLVGLIG